MNWLRLLGIALVFGSSGVRAADRGGWEGDYAGWGYEAPEAGGGDVPLRMHIRSAGGDAAPEVTVDIPSGRAYGVKVENTHVEGPRLEFQRRTSKGVLWTYGLTRDGDDFRGELDIGGTSLYRVQLHKSARSLAAFPEDRPDGVGCYRLDDGATIWISAQPWGELKYFDSRSARHGTLFALGGDSFFAGPADYVPSGVDAEVKIPKNPSGPTAELEWITPGSARVRARRVNIEDRDVEVKSGDAMIRGTLMIPPGSEPKGGVVIVGGSDWATRATTISDARVFLSMGMAALVYDRRGCGKSTGEELCTFAQSADDALALVNAVRAQPGIRKDGVGLAGRSRGGWTAPLAASRGDVAFVVMLSGAAVSPMQTQTTSRLNEMRDAGLDEKCIEEGREYLELLWASENSDDAWARYTAARERIFDRGWWKYLAGPDTRDSQVYRWQLLNYRYDPREALAHIHCPLLAVYGEFDNNITPGENVPALMGATTTLPKGRITIAVLQGADHGLRKHETDPTRRNRLHLLAGWSPEFLNTLRDWVVANQIAPGNVAAPD